MGILAKMIDYGRMVKFHHSVFALPFALAGTAFASMEKGITVAQVVWIVLAMVGARNAAMGFNRIADEKLDALNPRTSHWALQRKILKRWEVAIFVIALSALFVFSAYMLNYLCFYLSPLALFIIFFYSYTKRFTWLSQIFLGLSLSLSPIGAWIAIRGDITMVPILLGCAVIFWVAGFDTIYACQDYEFDLKMNLYSVPKRFGLPAALKIALFFHLASLIFLISVLYFLRVNPYIYSAGIVIIGIIIFYEHSLIKPDDLSKVNIAFFNMNGIISLVYLGTCTTSVMLS
ncbi:MAG: UbiA-like polyprenyltransferase [Acidobacteriota bacterium]